MPYIGLYMKADLENVKSIRCHPDMLWTLDVQQGGGSEVRERITVNPQEEFEIPNSKGTTNLVLKFDGAKQASTMSVIAISRKLDVKDKEVKGATLGEYSDPGGEVKPLALFDCRGIEPIRWYTNGPFIVETSGGFIFNEVDLSDDDGWCEYDQDADQPVQVSKPEFEFRIVK
mmetsp:Transcript_2877/g.6610  ORF Transcript_2877/g.6610 Transcript_2877/m.6610 type:complete len:173 (-) Transcript_2877:94-612(-)